MSTVHVNSRGRVEPSSAAGLCNVCGDLIQLSSICSAIKIDHNLHWMPVQRCVPVQAQHPRPHHWCESKMWLLVETYPAQYKMPEYRGKMPPGYILTRLVWNMLSVCAWIRASISRPRKSHIDAQTTFMQKALRLLNSCLLVREI